MTTVHLKASLALWRRRLAARHKLQVTAHQDLDEARAKGKHPRQDLLDRANLRDKQVTEAKDRIELRQKQLDAKHKGTVRRPGEQIRRNVACQSSRGGVKPRVIVLHDTEGANLPGIRDLQGLGDFFDRISTQASAHVGVDAEGNAARYVNDSAKAWHVAAFNPQSLGIEQIGFATQKDWPDAQLHKSAKYIAYWAKTYDIPITHSTSHGVCMHSDLGAAGGGHHDPGAPYPFDHVLGLARDYLRNGW